MAGMCGSSFGRSAIDRRRRRCRRESRPARTRPTRLPQQREAVGVLPARRRCRGRAGRCRRARPRRAPRRSRRGRRRRHRSGRRARSRTESCTPPSIERPARARGGAGRSRCRRGCAGRAGALVAERPRALARSSGVVIFTLRGLAVDQLRPRCPPLDQRGLVGGLDRRRPGRARPRSTLAREGLRRLREVDVARAARVASTQRAAVAGAAELHRVGGRHGRNRRAAAPAAASIIRPTRSALANGRAASCTSTTSARRPHARRTHWPPNPAAVRRRPPTHRARPGLRQARRQRIEMRCRQRHDDLVHVGVCRQQRQAALEHRPPVEVEELLRTAGAEAGAEAAGRQDRAHEGTRSRHPPRLLVATDGLPDTRRRQVEHAGTASRRRADAARRRRRARRAWRR